MKARLRPVIEPRTQLRRRARSAGLPRRRERVRRDVHGGEPRSRTARRRCPPAQACTGGVDARHRFSNMATTARRVLSREPRQRRGERDRPHAAERRAPLPAPRRRAAVRPDAHVAGRQRATCHAQKSARRPERLTSSGSTSAVAGLRDERPRVPVARRRADVPLLRIVSCRVAARRRAFWRNASLRLQHVQRVDRRTGCPTTGLTELDLTTEFHNRTTLGHFVWTDNDCPAYCDRVRARRAGGPAVAGGELLVESGTATRARRCTPSLAAIYTVGDGGRTTYGACGRTSTSASPPLSRRTWGSARVPAQPQRRAVVRELRRRRQRTRRIHVRAPRPEDCSA